MSRILISILLSISFCLVYAQDITSDNLDDHFTNYSIGQTNLAESIIIDKDRIRWTISIGELKGREAIIYANDLFSEDYTSSTISSSLIPTDLPRTYSGYLLDDTDSNIRITTHDGHITGYIATSEGKYYLEPIRSLDKSTSTDHVLYNENDVKNLKEGLCAASQVYQKSSIDPSASKSATKSNGCRTYQIAIAADYAYFLAHGGISGAIAQSTAVMNMVAGDYDDPFSDEVRFQIVEHWISNCSTCDPWTSSANASSLLNDFTDWAPNGFNNDHDLGQLWTRRDIVSTNNQGQVFTSTVGLAFIDVVCRSFKYHLLEDFTSISWALRVLTTHEMGHNFGYGHDPGGTSFIMSPSITNTSAWSSNSINSINTALSRHTCFTSCGGGANNASCNNVITLSGSINQSQQARQLIQTTGSVTVSQNVTLSAPNVSINNLTVARGRTLTLNDQGCF